MHIRRLAVIVCAVAAILVGCASRQAAGPRLEPRIAALKCEPGWAAVEAAVRSEVGRNEGAGSSLASAFCTPVLHTNGTWAVVVSADYPDYRAAEHVNVLVPDAGTIGAYSRKNAPSGR